jgi:hypothetical protein
MFIPLTILAVAAFIALIAGGGMYFMRRFAVVAIAIFAFLVLMFLVMLAETIIGIHPRIGMTILCTIALTVLVVIRVLCVGGVEKLVALWTPRA